MARKPSISILQFDTQAMACLRVAEGTKGIEIEEFARETGAWSMEDGSLEAALGAFVSRLNLAQDTVYTILPRHEITSRILTLPSQNDTELASMVRFSAEEFVPFGADELIIDFSTIRRLENGESQVLAVFAHRDLVEGHIQLLRKVDIEPAEILLSSACLASAAIAARGTPEARYALVDLGSSGLEVLAFDGRHVQYTRGVGMVQEWSRPLEEAPAMADELALELRSSLAAYRRESSDGLGVEEIYLCSDWTDTTPFAQVLEHEMAKTCAPADFARALVAQGVEKLHVLPVAALGAALTARGEAAVDIRLLPEHVQRRRALHGVKRTAARAAAVAALVLLALGGLYLQAVHQRKQVIRDLERELAAIAPLAEGVAEKQHQLRILRQQVNQKGTVLELLAAIANAAPQEGLNITKFDYDRMSGIDIWGRARTNDEVFAFVGSIRSLAVNHLNILAQARDVYQYVGQEREESVVEYQVNIAFSETGNEQALD